MQDDTNRKPTQGWLALECESDLGVYNLSTETPTQNMEMSERIVAPSNVREAYRRVFRRNGFTLAPCEHVTETPWYVIRMPGVVGGVAPRGVPLSRLYVTITYHSIT